MSPSECVTYMSKFLLTSPTWEHTGDLVEHVPNSRHLMFRSFEIATMAELGRLRYDYRLEGSSFGTYTLDGLGGKLESIELFA